MIPEDKNKNTCETTFDFQSAYSPESGDIKIKVESTDYSNMAYILVSYRDVMIDFLKVPGIKEEDGKNTIPATRIYMSHVAAKRLADSINRTLENAYDSGQIEQYSK
jgi:hypothetical protein